MRLGIDTNILIYAFNEASSFHEKCLDFIENSDHELMIPQQCIFEFLRVVTHHKFPNNLCMLEAVKYVQKLISKFKVVFESSDDFDLFVELCKKYNLKSNKIFDIKIVTTLINNGVDGIVTANEKDFNIIEEIKVVNPTKK